MSRVYRTWTIAEHHRAAAMRTEGMQTVDIAAELGRTVASVCHHLRGVPPPPRNGNHRDRILPGVEMLRAGDSIADAAATVGMDYENFCRSVRRHHGERPGTIRRRAIVARLVRLLDLGMMLPAAAAAIDIPRTTAQRYAVANGFTYSQRAGWTRAMAAK